MSAAFGRFGGHVIHMGPVPEPAFAELSGRLSTLPEAAWRSSDGPTFSQPIEGLNNIALMFPPAYPASHLGSRPTGHWSSWQSCVEPIVADIVCMMGMESFALAKVLLSRLKAGRVIAEHVDRNEASQVPHKVHVPVITSPNVIVTVEDAPYHLAPGQAYELNNLRRHAVYNRSSVDRVHLIVELYDPAAPC